MLRDRHFKRSSVSARKNSDEPGKINLPENGHKLAHDGLDLSGGVVAQDDDVHFVVEHDAAAIEV
jgi:hypothetical protein